MGALVLCQLWIWPFVSGLLASNNTTVTKVDQLPLPINFTQTTTPSTHERYSNLTSTNTHRNWREIARNKSMLVKNLLSNYDKRIRPFTGVLPLEVRVDMFISNIWAIEEARMDFTIDIYLRQYWRDPRLIFDPVAVNTDILTLNRQTIDEIWIPSTYFFNAKKAYFHDVTTENYLLMIKPNGDVFYSVRLTITMACKLTLQMFPHDVQVCTMMLESYGYQATDVYYRWNSRNSTGDVVYISEDLEMPQFKITNVNLEERTNIYNIGPHSALIAKFTFHRRLGYYMIQTYIPSMLTVTISWFSFWISPDSPPARVGLGITTVLTMITISNSARAPLPKVSYTKAIDWFLLMCLVYVFGALMEYAIVNFYACKVQQKKRNKSAAMRYSKRMQREAELEDSYDDDEANPCLNGGVPPMSASAKSRWVAAVAAARAGPSTPGVSTSRIPPAPEEKITSFRSLTTVVMDRKNPFFPRSYIHRRGTKRRAVSERIPATSLKDEDNSTNNATEDNAETPPAKPYYFWDPYEAAFMATEPAYTVDRYARIYFPVTFAVLNSIYWIVYAPDKIIF